MPEPTFTALLVIDLNDTKDWGSTRKAGVLFVCLAVKVDQRALLYTKFSTDIYIYI